MADLMTSGGYSTMSARNSGQTCIAVFGTVNDNINWVLGKTALPNVRLEPFPAFDYEMGESNLRHALERTFRILGSDLKDISFHAIIYVCDFSNPNEDVDLSSLRLLRNICGDRASDCVSVLAWSPEQQDARLNRLKTSELFPDWQW
jgi:hypothetical protein